jgi:hypothetical protein
MDDTDRRIINALQGEFPLSDEPYREVAEQARPGEDEVIARLQRLLDDRVLTRFGPMYQIERMGGAFVLAAMAVPEAQYERGGGGSMPSRKWRTTTGASTRSTCGSCSPPRRRRASPTPRRIEARDRDWWCYPFPS